MAATRVKTGSTSAKHAKVSNVAPKQVPTNDAVIPTPSNTADRLTCIHLLGKRIDTHIREIDALGKLTGTSQEAKDNAVTGFYECMRNFEERLARIHDQLRLE